LHLHFVNEISNTSNIFDISIGLQTHLASVEIQKFPQWKSKS